MDINEQVSRITGLWRYTDCANCVIWDSLGRDNGGLCFCMNRCYVGPYLPLDFLNDDAAFGKLVKWCSCEWGWNADWDSIMADNNPAEALCMAVIEANKER